jgi:hypothetical protein
VDRLARADHPAVRPRRRGRGPRGAPPIGSLYLLLYEHRPEQFRAALEAVLSHSGRAMLFDLVYLERYGWWSLLPHPVQAGR